MTIQLYLRYDTFLEDIKVIKQITDAGHPEIVNGMREFLKPINISSTPFNHNNITISVSFEELALIGVFNGGI